MTCGAIASSIALGSGAGYEIKLSDHCAPENALPCWGDPATLHSLSLIVDSAHFIRRPLAVLPRLIDQSGGQPLRRITIPRVAWNRVSAGRVVGVVPFIASPKGFVEGCDPRFSEKARESGRRCLMLTTYAQFLESLWEQSA